MKFQKKRLIRSTLLLALALLVPLISLPLANAANFVNQVIVQSCTTATCIGTFGTVVSGNEMIVIVDTQTPGASTQAVTDSQGNSYSNPITLTSNGNIRERWFIASLGSSSADTVTVTTTGAFNSLDADMLQYSGFVGIGATAQNVAVPGSGSGSDALTINIATNSMVLETGVILNSLTNTCGSISMTDTQRANVCDTSGPSLGMRLGHFEHNALSAGSNTFTLTYSGWNVPAGFIHLLVEITSSSPPAGLVTTTTCYGNCGNPAITLTNTNSSHTVNFNQSITLFYEFQANVNGFLLNVTTSLAKSYTALPNGPSFGVYTIPNCPLGQTPFSAQCPGLLQAQSSQASPPKGKISLSGLAIPVANGQWVGIALSASLSGLDVNDTNTNVNLFQTNEGKIPAVIQAPQTLGNSKVGLWAWIKGNVITGIPPPSSPTGACGGLDCILAAVVNSSCTLVTTACQTGSGLFWIIILTIVTLMSVLAGFSYIMPNVNISTRGMGEFAILIFVGWFTVFGAFGLILPWLMILMFFVIAWLFIGRAKGSGPI